MAVVAQAAVNIRVRVSFQNLSFLWVHTQEWDRRVIWQVLFFVFLKRLCIVLHGGLAIYLPTDSVQEFPFPHTLSGLYYLYTF